MKTKEKQKPLLRVYSAKTGTMFHWIKQGLFTGKDSIFYSAASLSPLIKTLRKIKSTEDLDNLKDELMAHINNINDKENI